MSIILATILAAATAASAPPPTLRVDIQHAGTASTEDFALDRVVVEPLPWPGNPAQPSDDTNRGVQKFEVTDP